MVELPPGVVAIYPSSLFFHFNIDIAGEWAPTPFVGEQSFTGLLDITFHRTTSATPPTRETALPLNRKGGSGRGSIVFFNQATMFQSSELGYGTPEGETEVREKTDEEVEHDVRGLKNPVLVPLASFRR